MFILVLEYMCAMLSQCNRILNRKKIKTNTKIIVLTNYSEHIIL